MKQFFCYISLALICFSLSACESRRVKGSGNMSREEREVGNFHKVELRGGMDVYFTQGPAQPAVIEADDNIIPLIELREENGVLLVRMRRNYSISTHNDIKIMLTAPDVDALSLSGSGNIKLMNTLNATDHLSLGLSGSGDIIGTVNTPRLKTSLTGSGNIKLAGDTRDAGINIAGSGNFEGNSLMSENTVVSIAGSGNVYVHASVKLDVKIAGSGDVKYKGDPQVSSKIAGSGSVQKQ